MCSGQDFVDTLKRLHFPDADKLNGASFDWLFLGKSEKGVGSFLTEFCSLTEDNVLTPGELKEYESLSAEDLAKMENFELPSSESKFMEEEAIDKVQYLKEQLSGIEKYNNALEHQRNNLKDHEKKLLDEKEKLEKIFLREKKKFWKLEKEQLPEIESQLTLSFQAISRTAQDINTLLHRATSDDIYFPSKEKFKKDTELYLEKERKLLGFIIFYLTNNLEQFSGLNKEGSDSKKETSSACDLQVQQMKEVSLLQKVSKIAKDKKIKATFEKEKLNGELEFYETLKDVNVLQSYELPDYLLKEKIAKVEESLEKYRKLEKQLISDCDESITKNVDAKCEQIAVASTVTKIRQYKSSCVKMTVPLDLLLAQKARLELLLTFFSLQEERFFSVKNILEEVSRELLQDFIEFNERKAFYEGIIYKEEENEVEYLPNDSVLFQLYCILEDPEKLPKLESLKLTPEDVLLKIESLYAANAEIEKLKEDHLNSSFRTLEMLEKRMFSLEGVALEKDKRIKHLRDEEQDFNTELNRLDIKNSMLSEVCKAQQSTFQGKNKLLERNSNLRKARKLYIHALTNPELFLQDIAEINLKAKECRLKDSTSQK